MDMVEYLLMKEDLRFLDRISDFVLRDADPAARLRARIDHMFALRGGLFVRRVERHCCSLLRDRHP